MIEHQECTPGTSINMGQNERMISAIAGSLLLYYVMNKNKASTLFAMAAGYLVYRGVSGHCPLYSLRERIATAEEDNNIGMRHE